MRVLAGETGDEVLGAISPVHRRFTRPHWLSATVFFVVLVFTVAAVLVSLATVSGQDNRLLSERANEVAQVFSAEVSAIPAALSTLGNIAQDGGTALFTEEARKDVAAGPGTLTFALMRPQSRGYVVVAAAGSGLVAGQRVSGLRASVMAEAQKVSHLVTTPVLGAGAQRALGFAWAVPSGMVVYRQSALGRLRAPRAAGTAPFQGLQVVLYDSSRPEPVQVLVTTTSDLPLRRPVQYIPVMAGASEWLLGVSSVHPLVGSVADWTPWMALGLGVLGALLVSLIVEQALRRRDAAVALYQSERRMAETLQRKLLPGLSAPAGLDVASRYVAASDGQQVGGDWFDVFEIGDGYVAVVIGDVMGHDIEAAAAMAQVRAGLRAYAWEEPEPAAVMRRLAGLVDAFSIAALVTVVYGVLSPPDEDGARRLQWANAGHLPPLLHLADGQVSELVEGSSSVIGAPSSGARDQGQRLLPPGSALILYTDGLVEVPGVAITDSIAQLRAGLERQPGGTSANDLCAAALRARSTVKTRDDIAILAVRLLSDRQPRGDVPTAQVTLEGVWHRPQAAAVSKES